MALLVESRFYSVVIFYSCHSHSLSAERQSILLSVLGTFKAAHGTKEAVFTHLYYL